MNMKTQSENNIEDKRLKKTRLHFSFSGYLANHGTLCNYRYANQNKLTEGSQTDKR